MQISVAKQRSSSRKPTQKTKIGDEKSHLRRENLISRCLFVQNTKALAEFFPVFPFRAPFTHIKTLFSARQMGLNSTGATYLSKLMRRLRVKRVK